MTTAKCPKCGSLLLTFMETFSATDMASESMAGVPEDTEKTIECRACHYSSTNLAEWGVQDV